MIENKYDLCSYEFFKFFIESLWIAKLVLFMFEFQVCNVQTKSYQQRPHTPMTPISLLYPSSLHFWKTLFSLLSPHFDIAVYNKNMVWIFKKIHDIYDFTFIAWGTLIFSIVCAHVLSTFSNTTPIYPLFILII